MTPPLQRLSRARLFACVVAGTVTVMATGCSPQPAGDPARPTSTNSSATPLPSSRPPIPRPLDANTYRDKPCTLFTDEQARVLGYLKPGTPDQTSEPARCSWRAERIGDADLNVDYYASTDLLGQIYRRETTSWPSNSLLPLTIAGQPALRTTFPTTELCRVALGLTNNQAVEIRVADKHINSCDRAVQVAETIVHNLSG